MARLGVDLSGVRLHGHTLPLYRGPERRGTARSLLVGDAAGLVDSFSGEGVRHAIASGRIAAQAILEGQAGAYSRRIERYALVALRPTRTVSEIFYRIPRLCFQYGMQNPRSTHLLADWLNGKMLAKRVS